MNFLIITSYSDLWCDFMWYSLCLSCFKFVEIPGSVGLYFSLGLKKFCQICLQIFFCVFLFWNSSFTLTIFLNFVQKGFCGCSFFLPFSFLSVWKHSFVLSSSRVTIFSLLNYLSMHLSISRSVSLGKLFPFLLCGLII